MQRRGIADSKNLKTVQDLGSAEKESDHGGVETTEGAVKS